MARAIRIGASPIVWLGGIVGGKVLCGESPRLLVYAYLFQSLLRLLAFGLLDAAWRVGGDGARRLVVRWTRSPGRDEVWSPVREGEGADARPSGLAAYLCLLMAVGGTLVVMMNVEGEDGVLKRFRTGLGTELAWGALFAAFYLVRDLIDRGIVMEPGRPARHNLGYNASGVVTVCVAALIGGLLMRHLDAGWAVAGPLIALKHSADLQADVRTAGRAGA